MERIRLVKEDLEWVAVFSDATVTRTWGKIGGKLQVETKTWKSGKNAGKVNATTPQQQCRRDIVGKALKKITENYQVMEGQSIIDEYSTGLAQETHFDAIEPMLAHPIIKHLKKVLAAEYIMAQPKKDGNRCTINITTGKMYTRKRKEIISIPGLGDIVAKACQPLYKNNGVTTVDGELFDPALTFNQIQSIMRSKTPVEGHEKIKFNMFDYVIDRPAETRAAVLTNREFFKPVVDHERIKVLSVEFYEFATAKPTTKEWKESIVERPLLFGELSEEILNNESATRRLQWLTELHDEYVKNGDEGLICRLPGYTYESKRSMGLLKMKEFEDAEFTVIGWYHEENNEDKMGGAICWMHDNNDWETKQLSELDEADYFNAVPKMSAEDKAKIWAERENYIGMKATVRFQGRDIHSNKPRFGRIIGFGEDKQ